MIFSDRILYTHIDTLRDNFKPRLVLAEVRNMKIILLCSQIPTGFIVGKGFCKFFSELFMNEKIFGGPIYPKIRFVSSSSNRSIKTLSMEFNRRHFRTRDIRNDFFRRLEYKSEDYIGHTRRIRLS